MKLRYLVLAARIVLGLTFFAPGINFFFPFFLDLPAPGPEANLVNAFAATGYMLPLIRATETVAGALLVTGVCVPLALMVLAPVIVNVLALHLFLAPRGLPLAIFLTALETLLAWHYRESFAPLFRTAARSCEHSL